MFVARTSSVRCRAPADGTFHKREEDPGAELSAAPTRSDPERCDMCVGLDQHEAAIPEDLITFRRNDIGSVGVAEFVEEDPRRPRLWIDVTFERCNRGDIAARHGTDHDGHIPSDRNIFQLICTSGSRMYKGRTSSAATNSP